MAERRIDKMGARLDGWADLVDGAGDRFEQVRTSITDLVSARKMPDVIAERRELTTGGLAGNLRMYIVCCHRAGVTMALNVRAVGKDLYVSWNAFYKPIWNKLVIVGILLISALLALAAGNDMYCSGWGNNCVSSFSVAKAAVVLAVGAVGLGLLVSIAGRVVKNNPMAFFMTSIDEFISDDITAMMLAVHHSVLQSLDIIGIDRKVLRVKEHYTTGARNRVI
jgi:hypothetical protein